MCLSASQVLAFGQAAVRLERTHSRAEGRSLSRRKLYMSVVCLFAGVSWSYLWMFRGTICLQGCLGVD